MAQYDVIIVGASFAGLALASQIKGEVLLIDKKPIGTGQTSACATSTKLVRKLGAEESIMQIHSELVFHLEKDEIRFPLKQEYCTLDYFRFCQCLYQNSHCDFLRANVKGFKDGKVLTSEGEYAAPFIVDASGWRAILASACQPTYVQRRDLIVGIEAEFNFPASGLHFWLLPRFPGYFWQFPCGNISRFGVGSYLQQPNIKSQLASFLKKTFGFHLTTNVHGGTIPTKLRKPVINQIFVVGDAAGQCYGLSAEGIRSTLHFGIMCGQLIQNSLSGILSRDSAFSEYANQVNRYRGAFATLSFLQKIFPYMPYSAIVWVTHAFKRRAVPFRVLEAYRQVGHDSFALD